MLVNILISTISVPFLFFFSYQISKKYNSLAMFVSLIFTIFWSLVGAIPLLIGKFFKGENKSIFIIENELFVIFPNLNYLYVLLSYILFISTILFLLWRSHPFLEKKFQGLSKAAWENFATRFSHSTLLFLNLIIAVFLFFKLNAIELAAGDKPVYLTDFRVPSRIIDYARTGLIFSTALGAILLVIDTWPKSRKKKIYTFIYLFTFLLACYPFWISGSRNTLFLTMVGLTVGTATLKKDSNFSIFHKLDQIKLIIALVLISFICISVTSTTRGFSLNSQSVAIETNTDAPKKETNTDAPNMSQNKSDLIIKSTALLRALTSKSSYVDWVGRGEILDSHASLYGVMIRMSAPPSIKLENSYGRYAKIVGASGSKGYTINPVAALWMNIGIFAPLVAGGYFTLVILFLVHFSSITKIVLAACFTSFHCT